MSLAEVKAKITRESLMAEVASLQQRISGWEYAAERAQKRRSTLGESIGERVLDDPDAAEEATAEYAQAAIDMDVAERAVAAAGPRLDRARRAVLEFDADALDEKISLLRAEYDAHVAKTEKLLKALYRHEGKGDFVRTGAVEFERTIALQPSGAFGVFRNTKADPWRSDELRAQIAELELRQGVLRDVAQGVDPSHRFHARQIPEDPSAIVWAGGSRSVYDFYPPTVRGPEALIEAPRFTSKWGI